MAEPVFPLISIDNDGVFDIILSAVAFSNASTRILTNTTYFDKIELFDRNSCKWKHRQVSADLKNNWLTKLLANTVYDPILNTKVIWTFDVIYQMNELKEKLKDCVDKDDDIITQFEEADAIKASIGKATNFDEILIVLNKYVFDVDEEQLWNEQQARGQ